MHSKRPLLHLNERLPRRLPRKQPQTRQRRKRLQRLLPRRRRRKPLLNKLLPPLLLHKQSRLLLWRIRPRLRWLQAAMIPTMTSTLPSREPSPKRRSLCCNKLQRQRLQRGQLTGLRLKRTLLRQMTNRLNRVVGPFSTPHADATLDACARDV